MSGLLTTAHGELINRGLQALANALPIIEAAEKAGVDCTEYRQGHAEMQRRLMSYRGQFFPNQVTPPLPQGVPNANP
jgi:hypothetical protein